MTARRPAAAATSCGPTRTARRSSTCQCGSTPTRTPTRRPRLGRPIADAVAQAPATLNRYPDRDAGRCARTGRLPAGHGYWPSTGVGGQRVERDHAAAPAGLRRPRPDRAGLRADLLDVPAEYAADTCTAWITGSTAPPTSASTRAAAWPVATPAATGVPDLAEQPDRHRAAARRRSRRSAPRRRAWSSSTRPTPSCRRRHAERVDPAARPPRLVVTRTMSKAFAFAGARLATWPRHPAVVDALLHRAAALSPVGGHPGRRPGGAGHTRRAAASRRHAARGARRRSDWLRGTGSAAARLATPTSCCSAGSPIGTRSGRRCSTGRADPRDRPAGWLRVIDRHAGRDGGVPRRAGRGARRCRSWRAATRRRASERQSPQEDQGAGRARPRRHRRDEVATGVLLRPHARAARQARPVRPAGPADGDLEIDAHHTVEDTAIALGQALRRRSATRPASAGSATPSSRSTRRWCQAAVDLSGRPYLVHTEPDGAALIGSYATTLTRHVWSRSPTHAGSACTSTSWPAATRTTSPRPNSRRWPVRCAPPSRSTPGAGHPVAPRACSRRGRQVVVLDYGSGNLRSAQRALRRVGAQVEVTADAGGAGGRRAGGSRGRCVRGVHGGLRAIDGRQIVAERLAGGRPVLGICVGMQVLFEARRRARRADRTGFALARRGRSSSPGAAAHGLEHRGSAPARRCSPGSRTGAVLLRALLRAGAAGAGDWPRRRTNTWPSTASRSSPRSRTARCARPSSTRRSPATPAPLL